MTRQQWIEEAERWDRAAREARAAGDESGGEWREAKANACRTAADYARDTDDEGGDRDE